MELILAIHDARGELMEARVSPAPRHEDHGWLVEVWGQDLIGAFPITVPGHADMAAAIEHEAQARGIFAQGRPRQ